MKLGKTEKLYLKITLASILGNSLFALGLMVSAMLMFGIKYEVPLDSSLPILSAIVELDGILFGLSAITMALFFDALKERRNKKLTETFLFLSATSFVSFIISLTLTFTFMMMPNPKLFHIFFSIGSTLFGASCATLYMVTTYMELRNQ